MGGIIMTISGLFYFIVFFGTLFGKKRAESILEFPESEAYHDEKRIRYFDSFKPWLVIMIIIILIAYLPAIFNIEKNSGPGAPTFLPANPTPGSR
jgi:cytochrome c oxidase subunit 1